jgi:hypothetical protein
VYLRTWILVGLSYSYELHACSHFLAILFERIKMILLVTSIRSFVMVHFCGPFFGLIAHLKLCAPAALDVFTVDKETYSIINSKDYIIKKCHPIL